MNTDRFINVDVAYY